MSNLHVLTLTGIHPFIHPEPTEVRVWRNPVFGPTSGGAARSAGSSILRNEHGAMGLDIRVQVRQVVRVDRNSKAHSEPEKVSDQRNSVIPNEDTSSAEGQWELSSIIETASDSTRGP